MIFVFLGDNEGVTLRGNSNQLDSSFKEIPNLIDYVAISTVSDENDRYTKDLHLSYEFKIPIELVDRSDNYGFYLAVYDSSTDKSYSWLGSSSYKGPISIPSPSSWGDIISPDKSLPEYGFPMLILSILLLSVIIVQTKTKMLFLK